MTTSERAALELALDSDMPYLGLRGMNPDPNLLLYLPAALRRGGEVAPLRLDDNVLQLACAAPDVDLAALRVRLPRLSLELSISPPDDIRAVLAQMTEHAG